MLGKFMERAMLRACMRQTCVLSDTENYSVVRLSFQSFQNSSVIAADFRSYFEHNCFYTGRCDYRYNAKQRTLHKENLLNARETLESVKPARQ